MVAGHSVLGGFEMLTNGSLKNCKVLIAVGDNLVRRRLCERVESHGYSFARAIHPSSKKKVRNSLDISELSDFIELFEDNNPHEEKSVYQKLQEELNKDPDDVLKGSGFVDKNWTHD